jgi:hypothetical protein
VWKSNCDAPAARRLGLLSSPRWFRQMIPWNENTRDVWRINYDEVISCFARRKRSWYLALVKPRAS